MIESSQNSEESIHDLSFGKEYKLCSKKKIEEIFEAGKLSKSFPLKAIWTREPYDDKSRKSIQVAFTVPKRSFKRAHDRNRIKRLMREAFRLNKDRLEKTLETENQQLSVFILYQERVELSFQVIEKRMIKLVEQITNTLKNEIH